MCYPEQNQLKDDKRHQIITVGFYFGEEIRPQHGGKAKMPAWTCLMPLGWQLHRKPPELMFRFRK
jgi:hypothetical protein